MKLLLELSMVTQQACAPTHIVRMPVTHGNEKRKHCGQRKYMNTLLYGLTVGNRNAGPQYLVPTAKSGKVIHKVVYLYFSYRQDGLVGGKIPLSL